MSRISPAHRTSTRRTLRRETTPKRKVYHMSMAINVTGNPWSWFNAFPFAQAGNEKQTEHTMPTATNKSLNLQSCLQPACSLPAACPKWCPNAEMGAYICEMVGETFVRRPLFISYQRRSFTSTTTHQDELLPYDSNGSGRTRNRNRRSFKRLVLNYPSVTYCT